MKTTVGTLCALVTVGLIGFNLRCEATQRHFTLVDDATWSRFGDPYNLQVDPITFSPNSRLFVVHTEKGILETNRSESTLRVYRSEDVRSFLLHSEIIREPTPVWIIRKSTYKDGPIITHIRWLPDSSGFAFLAKSAHGGERLFLADVARRTEVPLTLRTEVVMQFDVRDARHYVYCILSPSVRESAHLQGQSIGQIGTGRSLGSLMFPTDTEYGQVSPWYDLGELWAVLDGERFRIRDKASGRPLPLHWAGERIFGRGSLTLSPDRNSAVAIMAVATIPPAWKELYPPPDPSSATQIRTAGRQDLWALDGFDYASEYVLINLKTGAVKALTGAPTGLTTSDWGGLETADWSFDGRSLVLSNTFIPSETSASSKTPNPPCVTVVDLPTNHLTCVEPIKGGIYASQGSVVDAYFAPDKSGAIIVDHMVEGTRLSTRYWRTSSGSWSLSEHKTQSITHTHDINVWIKEDLNMSPVLTATDIASSVSRVIWDPNPQFKDIDLGDASVVNWKDKTGRSWTGVLYKPPDYIAGHKYPLVVQTHGFVDHAFRPSGIYPTGFAARELAAAGILVLQVQDCPIFDTPEEGPCNVAGYESGINKLISDGLADASRLGIVGFSRTCFDVLETLVTGDIHFKAASITEGFNMGYMEYIQYVDYSNNFNLHTIEAALGVPAPVGKGLNEWLRLSPVFNLDKVRTPLQVVATNSHNSLLEMWESYAVLRSMQRPVDLIILGPGTHPLTNPAQQMISQAGTVDWMRFWLTGAEDPDPAKAEQYDRWHQLRKLHDNN